MKTKPVKLHRRMWGKAPPTEPGIWVHHYPIMGSFALILVMQAKGGGLCYCHYGHPDYCYPVEANRECLWAGPVTIPNRSKQRSASKPEDD